MIRRFAPLSVILLSFLLVACSDSDAPPTETAPAATEGSTRSNDPVAASGDISPSWTLTVTGAETLDLDIEPRFGCSDEQVHVLTMSQSPRFDLYLPAAIEPGTYPLARFDPNVQPSFVAGHGVVSLTGAIVRGSGRSYGTFYSIPEAGEITIERMPSEAGDFFSAELAATLASRDGDTIELRGELNLQASGMMLMNCRF